MLDELMIRTESPEEVLQWFAMEEAMAMVYIKQVVYRAWSSKTRAGLPFGGMRDMLEKPLKCACLVLNSPYMEGNSFSQARGMGRGHACCVVNGNTRTNILIAHGLVLMPMATV